MGTVDTGLLMDLGLLIPAYQWTQDCWYWLTDGLGTAGIGLPVDSGLLVRLLLSSGSTPREGDSLFRCEPEILREIGG